MEFAELAFLEMIGRLLNSAASDNCLGCNGTYWPNREFYRGFFRGFLELLKTLSVDPQELDDFFKADGLSSLEAWKSVRLHGDIAAQDCWVNLDAIPCSFTTRRLCQVLVKYLSRNAGTVECYEMKRPE